MRIKSGWRFPSIVNVREVLQGCPLGIEAHKARSLARARNMFSFKILKKGGVVVVGVWGKSKHWFE